MAPAPELYAAESRCSLSIDPLSVVAANLAGGGMELGA